MALSSTPSIAVVVTVAAVLPLFVPAATSAQDRHGTVFGTVGFASIGHADSEQGKAPIFGGGAAFRLTPRLVVEGDVHGARVRDVFGQQHHTFNETTITGSLLFRSSPQGRVHVTAGGGLAFQRAHSDFELSPGDRIVQTETIRLWHGRGGVEWDASDRVAVMTDGVLWFGPGIDWVLGGRVGIGYRF